MKKQSKKRTKRCCNWWKMAVQLDMFEGLSMIDAASTSSSGATSRNASGPRCWRSARR